MLLLTMLLLWHRSNVMNDARIHPVRPRRVEPISKDMPLQVPTTRKSEKTLLQQDFLDKKKKKRKSNANYSHLSRHRNFCATATLRKTFSPWMYKQADWTGASPEGASPRTIGPNTRNMGTEMIVGGLLLLFCCWW